MAGAIDTSRKEVEIMEYLSIALGVISNLPIFNTLLRLINNKRNPEPDLAEIFHRASLRRAKRRQTERMIERAIKKAMK
jgi:hypothetical protein